jgi:DNA (cytosine-5)-methyltransferase 1
MLTFGSLFAGIGGFDLGFERAGMVCKWQVEIDERCRQVLGRHWPDVKRYGDVKDVGRDNLGTVDVICGGFPCQDVSVAGRREGLAGERSGLWFEFLRVIEEIKPEWVIVENVPGLLSSNEGRDMATIVGGLAKCGYWWAYRIIDLQYFGVPQRRRRVFIIGSLTRGRAQQVLFERESSPWDIAPGREAGEGITTDPESRLSRGGAVAFDWTADGSNDISWNGKPRSWIVKQGDYTGALSQTKVQAICYGGNNTSGPIDVAATRNAHGSNRYDFESETFVYSIWGGHKRKDRPKGGFYAKRQETTKTLDQSGLNPGACQGGNVSVDIFGVRRLTPTECERLQGFPDGHTDGQSDSARYRQLGNAVGVPKAEWLGQRLVETDA